MVMIGLERRMRELEALSEAEAIDRMIKIENVMRHNLGNVRKRLFAVEGTISTGKSTLVNLLGARVGLRPFLEEVDSNEVWHAIIEQFYKDRIKFGFSTQMALVHTRRWQADSAYHYPGSAAIDRTYWGDRFVFVPTLVDGGLPKSDVDKLEEEYVKFDSEFPPLDMLYVLTCSPETAQKRLLGRDRDLESGTDLATETIDENHYLYKIGKRCEELPKILRERGLYTGQHIFIDQDRFKLTDGRHVTALLEETASKLQIKY